MSGHVIRLLTVDEAQQKRAALIELLIDSVESGASVNFVLPMMRAKAERWWDGALASHARGERLIFTAENGSSIDGTVQLILAAPENQSFRADLAKMLVHSRARRKGLGALLMETAEAEARRIGRTLLTLDTEAGSDGERLYLRLGWIKFGEVPGFAMNAQGSERKTCSFFYKEL